MPAFRARDWSGGLEGALTVPWAEHCLNATCQCSLLPTTNQNCPAGPSLLTRHPPTKRCTAPRIPSCQSAISSGSAACFAERLCLSGPTPLFVFSFFHPAGLCPPGHSSRFAPGGRSHQKPGGAASRQKDECLARPERQSLSARQAAEPDRALARLPNWSGLVVEPGSSRFAPYDFVQVHQQGLVLPRAAIPAADT